MSKREHKRHTRRLETVFKAGAETFRGITSDISDIGMFIRTRYGLMPGSIIDIELYLPDGKIAKLRGEVRRSIKTPLSTFRNGMGIKIIENDANFMKLLEQEYDNPSSDSPQIQEAEPKQADVNIQIEHIIILCSSCKVKNKVKKEKLPLGPRCGRCGTVLKAEDSA
jgi:hypothetical protein